MAEYSTYLSGRCVEIKMFPLSFAVFDAYMRFGGMPGIADVGLDQEKALMLLEGIYSTVIVRDVLERESRRGQKKITDPVLLRKIVLYLADNIGSNISISSMISSVLILKAKNFYVHLANFML